MFKKKISYKKIALALSLSLVALWFLLGTGASLAWFSDETEDLRNIFHYADFELSVSYKNDSMADYEILESENAIFNDEAIYEPGYTQVVLLKVENKGTVPFDFYTAVSVASYVPAVNLYGTTFNLQDYLEFGVITKSSEQELLDAIASRDLARDIAYRPLSHYATESAELEAGGTDYVAIIVHMPDNIGNEANYRETSKPEVKLGVIVEATQKKNNQ